MAAHILAASEFIGVCEIGELGLGAAAAEESDDDWLLLFWAMDSVAKTNPVRPLTEIVDLLDEKEDPLYIPPFIGPLQKKSQTPAEVGGKKTKEKAQKKKKPSVHEYQTRRKVKQDFLKEVWGPEGHDPEEQWRKTSQGTTNDRRSPKAPQSYP